MLTSYSAIDFYLYEDETAAGKLIFSDGVEHAVSASIIDSSHCWAVADVKDNAIAVAMHQNLDTICRQESLIFQYISDLFDNQLYMRSLLSSQVCWLIGHFTEQLIPLDLFDELCTNEDIERKRAGILLQNVTNNANILLYRSAFSKLLISRELDFFNEKVILSPEQQKICIEYVKDLVLKNVIRIVDGGFSHDFEYISDPCIFLSDTVDYIRLENGKYQNNLVSIVNRKCREIYHCFFNTIWSGGAPNVISDQKNAWN